MSFSYPPPVITAEFTFDALRDQRISGFVEQWRDFQDRFPQKRLPDYDVETLRTSPAVIALETVAYGDLYFIDRSNNVARAALLVDFAKKSDLDLHGLATKVPGHPDGVIRHPGESDEDYAARIIEAKTGSSAAGPDEWWLTHARAADPRVRALGPSYAGRGVYNMYVLSRENGGVPDQAMLDAISARLNRSGVRPRGVRPVVLSAVIAEVDVVVDFWLLPEASEGRMTEIADAAKALHNAKQALDVDLTHFYLERLLDANDVYKVKIVSPAVDLTADPSRAYAIRSITPRLAGRAR